MNESAQTRRSSPRGAGVSPCLRASFMARFGHHEAIIIWQIPVETSTSGFNSSDITTTRGYFGPRRVNVHIRITIEHGLHCLAK
jgi:hypothetical protein